MIAAQWILIFLLPAVLALVLTPAIIRLAHKVGAMDHPEARKSHAAPMPRLGGVAVFVSIAITIVVVRAFVDGIPFPSWAEGTSGVLLAVSVAVICGIGILDDLYTLKPTHKLLVQFLLATILYHAGFRIDAVTTVLGDGSLELGAFNYLLTVVWIIGVTNAINLIDGLDGLASGVSGIAALTIAAISLLRGDSGTALMALVLAGAILGFLRYNFNPAKIFLGDSGSMFIGLALAVISTQSSTKSSTAFSLVVPVMALGLPIMDTILSMVRRLVDPYLTGVEHGKRHLGRIIGMFRPDRRHIHHRLIALGLTHRKAVLLLYVVSCTLGLLALLITVVNNTAASLVLFVVGISSVLGIRMLQYREMAVLRNGVLLPLFDLRIINHHFFQAFLDSVFILFAYVGAYLFTKWSIGEAFVSRALALPLSLACLIQFTVFYFSGCYRRTFRDFDVVDAIRVIRATALAVALTGGVFFAIPGTSFPSSWTILALDFYFLLTLTLGSRFSFRLLKHLFEVNTSVGRKVVIYGADDWGAFVLQRMLDNQIPNLRPVGFLDDRAHMQRSYVLGFPVLGDHTSLEHIAQLFDLDEVLIAVPELHADVLRSLQETTSTLGVKLRTFTMALVDVESEPREVMSHDPQEMEITPRGISVPQRVKLFS